MIESKSMTTHARNVAQRREVLKRLKQDQCLAPFQVQFHINFVDNRIVYRAGRRKHEKQHWKLYSCSCSTQLQGYDARFRECLKERGKHHSQCAFEQLGSELTRSHKGRRNTRRRYLQRMLNVITSLDKLPVIEEGPEDE